jgi:hypothetical protein
MRALLSLLTTNWRCGEKAVRVLLCVFFFVTDTRFPSGGAENKIAEFSPLARAAAEPAETQKRVIELRLHLQHPFPIMEPDNSETWRDAGEEGGAELENIWIASSDGDVGRVIQLLQEDPSMVNAQDESGYSPLYKDVNIKLHMIVKVVSAVGTPLQVMVTRS